MDSDDPPRAALDWTAEGAPRSVLFDDIYFQPGAGLEESQAVFLEGCGLPQAWRGRSRFVVGELGFGCGLNILALLDLWRREHAPGQHLHIVSIEAYPVTRAQAARALAAWPQLGDLAKVLLSAWPPLTPGFQRIDLPGLDAVIDLYVGEVAAGLCAWSGQADAWFLDGFSPAKNPQMWRSEVLALVAARSAPGARLATFTVAGAVRRGLADHGFAVDKRPGHGRKRERLEGRRPGAPGPERDLGRIVVVGGGIAGASFARAAAGQGLPVTMICGAPGASANPAALVVPAFDVGERAGARLSAQAFLRAVDLYARETPDAVIGRGLVQLERDARDAARFDALSRSRLFEPGTLQRLDAAAVAERLAEPLSRGGLLLSQALAIEPGVVVALWSAGAAQIEGRVDRMERTAGAWRLLDRTGRMLAEADTVLLAAGPGAPALGAPAIGIVRGQATWAQGDWPGGPGAGAAWGGYAMPMRGGVLFGATHDRGDDATDPRAEDDQRNLEQLRIVRPRLADALADAPLRARAALRATTRDHQPLAGAAPGLEQTYLLSGLGGRGFTTAPLLAEHVVALALGAPSPLCSDLAAIVDPARSTAR